MRDLFDNFELDDEIPDFDNPDAPKEPLRDRLQVMETGAGMALISEGGSA